MSAAMRIEVCSHQVCRAARSRVYKATPITAVLVLVGIFPAASLNHTELHEEDSARDVHNALAKGVVSLDSLAKNTGENEEDVIFDVASFERSLSANSMVASSTINSSAAVTVTPSSCSVVSLRDILLKLKEAIADDWYSNKRTIPEADKQLLANIDKWLAKAPGTLNNEFYGLILDFVNSQTLGQLQLTARDMDSVRCCSVVSAGKCTAAEETAPAGSIEGDMLLSKTGKPGPTWPIRAVPLDGGLVGVEQTEGLTVSEVPWCFDQHVDNETQKVWKAAVKHLQSQLSCVKFKQVELATPGTCQEAGDMCYGICAALPSVVVQSSKAGCWSYLGLVSHQSDAGFYDRSQPVNLGAGCGFVGLAAHQIGHLLGIEHEQSRQDRDSFVSIEKVELVNSAETSGQNFNIMPTAYMGSDYDYLSLMHYNAYAFSEEGEITVKPKEVRVTSLLGQRIGFSPADVDHIAEMYGGEGHATHKVSVQSLLAGDHNFKGECKDHAGQTGLVLNGVDLECQELVAKCDPKEELASITRLMCPVTCGSCTTTTTSAAPTTTTTTFATTTTTETPTTTTTQLPLCQDYEFTGIKFQNSSMATCTQLVPHCNHSGLGSRVQSKCRQSCGLCSLEIIRNSCIDRSPQDWPRFTITNVLAHCSQLKPFCVDYKHYNIVRAKCPATCEVCGAGSAAIKDDTRTGCNRRRDSGACATRRRDPPPPVVIGEGPAAHHGVRVAIPLSP